MTFWQGYVVHMFGTAKHKLWVAYYMLRLLWSYTDSGLRWYGPFKPWQARRNWLWRIVRHDWSKFRWDEASSFARTIFRLKTTPYGSPQYRRLLRQIKPAINAHYERHDHHPEHFAARALLEQETVYEVMPMICRLEMVCDWAAAVRRHENGDLVKSILTNMERFGYGKEDAEWLLEKARRIGAI